MPASVTLNVNDPTLAARNLRKDIFTQLQRNSPTWATLFGLDSDRVANGEQCESITVEAFEVLQRDIEIAEISDTGNIAPSASTTTAISKTIPTLTRALYGGLTCHYAAAPMSLEEWIHGGPGARHPRKKVYEHSIVNYLSRALLTGLFSAGAGANPDGLQKWTSKTANKWGLDTSGAANGYYRGQVETVATLSFDEDLVSEWIKIAKTGIETISGTTTYSDTSQPSLGLVDHNTFQRMKKWYRDRQTIEQSAVNSRQQEVMRIGGFYKNGLMIDEVVFVPELALDILRDDNSSVGEMFILDPMDLEVIFFKGFDFKFVANPDEAVGPDGFDIPMRDFADVVWGKYCVLIVLWNLFMKRCRNALYGQIT